MPVPATAAEHSSTTARLQLDVLSIVRVLHRVLQHGLGSFRSLSELLSNLLAQVLGRLNRDLGCGAGLQYNRLGLGHAVDAEQLGLEDCGVSSQHVVVEHWP